MLKEKVWNGHMLADLRAVYMTAFVLLVAATSLIPFRLATDGKIGILFTLMGLVGVFLLVVDFFLRGVLFQPKYSGILFLFIVACVISALGNIRYGYMDNIKTILWTCVQLFLLGVIDAEQPHKLHCRQLFLVTEAFGVVWMIGCVLSLRQFVLQYSDLIWLLDNVSLTHVGFSEGRLFGAFVDPNYAALCAEFVVVFAILWLRKGPHNIILRIYHVILIAVQVLYIVLSGSRTAEISAAAAVLLLAVFLVWCRCEKVGRKTWVRILCSLAAGVMASVFLIGGMRVLKAGLSYIPEIYAQAASAKTEQILGEEGGSGKDLATELPDEMDSVGQVDFTRPDVAEKDDISNNRFSIWSDYFRVFMKTPIWGTSPRSPLLFAEDHFDDLYILEMQYSVHNSYLALLVCTGVIGASIMLLWLVLTVVEVFQYLIRRRHSRDDYYEEVLILTVVLLISAVAAFPLMMLFFNNMIITIVFWIVIGYTLGFIRMSEPERYAKKTVPYQITEKIGHLLFRRNGETEKGEKHSME